MGTFKHMVSVLGLSFATGFGASGCLAEADVESDVGEAQSAASAPIVNAKIFKSGWPGTRGYKWELGDGRPIIPESVIVTSIPIYGAGSQSVGWRILDNNKLEISVTMPEGEAFNPNQHHANVVVIFMYR